MADILLRYWLPWYDSILTILLHCRKFEKDKLSPSEKEEGEHGLPHVVSDGGDRSMEGTEPGMGQSLSATQLAF